MSVELLNRSLETHKDAWGLVNFSPVNHVMRVAEGRALLAQGKSLSEMRVPIFIETDKDLFEIREFRLSAYAKSSDEELL